MKPLTEVFRHLFLRSGPGAAAFLRAMFAVAALAFVAHSHGADLRVISGGAAQQVLQTLSPKFESATGNKVELSFAVVGAIQQKLTAGEKGDVLLLPLPLLDALQKAGAFR